MLDLSKHQLPAEVHGDGLWGPKGSRTGTGVFAAVWAGGDSGEQEVFGILDGEKRGEKQGVPRMRGQDC